MADAARPELTDRQTAVLAAIERLGRPVMADLWREFPDLAPSDIKKVLDALEKKGLVEHAGDDSQVFVNAVHWWSTALTMREGHGGIGGQPVPMPDEEATRLLNEAYAGMRAGAGDEGAVEDAGALLLEGLRRLVGLDPGRLYVTLSALDSGALRFVAAQAVTELGQLRWTPRGPSGDNPAG